MYIWGYEGLGQSVYLGPAFDQDKAVKANRKYRNSLGWKKYLKRIQAFLNMSRVEVDAEVALASAVAEWQQKQTPAVSVDGTIGPTTWSRMRAAGALKGDWWWNRPCKITPVTNGEFGTALKWYMNTFCVPDEVAKLLKGSPKFLKIAIKLDAKYIAETGRDVELSETPPNDWPDVWGVTTDGVLTKGKYRGANVKGRRVLAISISFDGSSFEPAGSLEHLFSNDTIWLQPPPNAAGVGRKAGTAEIGGWIERIAHESIHAHHRVLRTGSSATKLAERVLQSIAEEITTRKQEAGIVSEIAATTLGKKLLKTFTPTTGAFDAASVQRDFFPSKLRRTYLEHFLLSALIGEAISRERLTAEAIAKKNEEADRLPLKGWRDRKFSSDYSKIRFWLRVIDFRWQQARKLHTPGSPEFERLKEQVLQEHANAFFGGVISYANRP